MSFSLDMTNLMSIAAELFNGLQGIVAVVGGLSLGAGLLYFVVKIVRNIF